MRFDLVRPCDNCPFRTDLAGAACIEAHEEAWP
jgi:hypothetical protein